MKKISTLLAAAACVLGLQAQTVTVSPHDNVCDVTVDGTTYNDVAVTTVGDIHLVALNRDGVSLLVRYTDANTVAAHGTFNGQPVNYTSDAVAAYAQTFQIPNSDFETWSTDNDITEPRYWHGFKSATGSLASQATSTLLKSNDVRTGASGSSAVIASKSIYGVVANGTMTNGRLMAQSMTASNTWNHSEMDQNSTATDKWGDKFYTALNAKPDAIKTWLKFTQGTDNSDYPYATLSAILFDGDKYQDPEPKKGDSSSLIGGTKYTQDDVDYAAARVAAKAQNKQIATGDWRELSIPFSYTDASKAKAILVTISTNATPGKGSANDQVWVDDMELVYNAAISNIALNGVTLEGFAFDAATKSYNVSYTGEALNLTVENFDVTAAGQSAMVVKNVENLGYGNYRVAIGATGPDFKNYDLYTINVTRNPLTGKAYVMGTVNGNTWAANVGYEMTAGENNVYTARITTTGSADGYDYFSFTTQLANDADGWDGIKGFRTGAESADLLIDDSNLGTALSLTDWGIYNSFKIAAGEWELTLDLNNKTLTVSKVFNPITGKLFILGDVNGNGWHANNGVEMSTEDQKIYTAEVTTAGENSLYYFGFTTELANDDDEGGWNYILPYRFGAPGEGTDVSITIEDSDLGTALALGEWGHTRAYALPAGQWNFTLDMEARTLTVTKATAPGLRGDINGDGVVDSNDINTIVNMTLGKAEKLGIADLNGDNAVDSQDVNILINIVLGKS